MNKVFSLANRKRSRAPERVVNPPSDNVVSIAMPSAPMGWLRHKRPSLGTKDQRDHLLDLASHRSNRYKIPLTEFGSFALLRVFTTHTSPFA
jgi:hypothetical protein